MNIVIVQFLPKTLCRKVLDSVGFQINPEVLGVSDRHRYPFGRCPLKHRLRIESLQLILISSQFLKNANTRLEYLDCGTQFRFTRIELDRNLDLLEEALH